MEELRKVSSIQLYQIWKNLSIGLLSIIAVITFSKILPFYLSPIISLLGAAGLYTYLYNSRLGGSTSCMLVPYSIFFCLISYSFITIVINVLYAWGIIIPPKEIVFFNDPYIPTLLMNPVSFVVVLVIYFRRHRLSICDGCKMHSGTPYDRGRLGRILNYESKLQLKNLMLLFGLLSVIIWFYYLRIYRNIDTNARDWYIFTWLTVIAYLIDEIYFIFRYYNLYLDLLENEEIITPTELNDMTAKTYLRFYVICDNNLYMHKTEDTAKSDLSVVYDTPFVTKRSVNGITMPEVKHIVSRMTGVKDGKLRFFFGRKLPDLERHSLLRYFYFVDESEEECPRMETKGSWMDFSLIKQLYSKKPEELSTIFVNDMSRLATIILTEKIFDEKGNRKSKIKTYQPSFDMNDIRNSNIDFQDDKWIKISMFNSDTPFFRLKKWYRGLFKSRSGSNSWG